MTYLLLDKWKNLIATKRDAIYRGEDLSEKITFVLPLSIGDIDIGTATVRLNYTRSDEWSNIVSLTKDDEMYSDAYYKFITPVDAHMSAKAGNLTVWLEISDGEDNPMIAKSSECILKILDTTDIDGHTPEDQEDKESIMASIAEIKDALKLKADRISYDAANREISIYSGDDKIGQSVVVPDDSYMDDVKDATEDVWHDIE